MVIPVYDSNPTRRRPYVTWALIAVLRSSSCSPRSPAGRSSGEPSTAQLCRQQAYFLEWGAVPTELTSNRPLRLHVRGGRGGKRSASRSRRTTRSGRGCPRSPRSSCTAAGCTCSATCCSSGSSATTSRTASAGCRFLLFYLGRRRHLDVRVRPDRAGLAASRWSARPARSPACSGHTCCCSRGPRWSAWSASCSSCRSGCRPGWCWGSTSCSRPFYAYGVGLAGGGAVAYLVHVVGFAARRRRGGRLPRPVATAAVGAAVGDRIRVMRQTRPTRAAGPAGRRSGP